MTDVPENTPFQLKTIEDQEKQAELERTWDLFQVELSADEVEWVARPNNVYWEPVEDLNTGRVVDWVPKDAAELPDHASIHPESGNIVMTARATVTCRARNEDHAKMLAMRDNPEYHTVDSVKNITNPPEEQ
jgi:hypothetical protein